MRHNWLFTVILFIIFCTVLLISGCQETNKSANLTKTLVQTTSEPNMSSPVIKFEGTEIDFGQVGPETINTKDLKFQNTGRGILKITEISKCCGIVVQADKDQYAPGETGLLKFIFHAKDTIETFERHPIVYSNDPVNPQIILNLTAEIVQKVVGEPENIRLLFDEENAACPKLTIRSIDKKEFAITGIRSTGNCITAEYNPIVNKTEHVLDLKVDMKKLPKGRYGEINVYTSHPEGNIATIFYVVVPKYTLSPKSLYILHMKENEAKKAIVKIINNYKDDIEIESTSSKEKTVNLIDYKKNQNNVELNLEITPPSVTEGTKSFTDIFYINLKNNEQLSLNLTGYYDD